MAASCSTLRPTATAPSTITRTGPSLRTPVSNAIRRPSSAARAHRPTPTRRTSARRRAARRRTRRRRPSRRASPPARSRSALAPESRPVSARSRGARARRDRASPSSSSANPIDPRSDRYATQSLLGHGFEVSPLVLRHRGIVARRILRIRDRPVPRPHAEEWVRRGHAAANCRTGRDGRARCPLYSSLIRSPSRDTAIRSSTRGDWGATTAATTPTRRRDRSTMSRRTVRGSHHRLHVTSASAATGTATTSTASHAARLRDITSAAATTPCRRRRRDSRTRDAPSARRARRPARRSRTVRDEIAIAERSTRRAIEAEVFRLHAVRLGERRRRANDHGKRERDEQRPHETVATERRRHPKERRARAPRWPALAPRPRRSSRTPRRRRSRRGMPAMSESTALNVTRLRPASRGAPRRPRTDEDQFLGNEVAVEVERICTSWRRDHRHPSDLHRP